MNLGPPRINIWGTQIRARVCRIDCQIPDFGSIRQPGGTKVAQKLCGSHREWETPSRFARARSARKFLEQTNPGRV